VLAQRDEDRTEDSGLRVVVAFEQPAVEVEACNALALTLFRGVGVRLGIEVLLEHLHDARLPSTPVAEHAYCNREERRVEDDGPDQVRMDTEADEVFRGFVVSPHGRESVSGGA
jgi:hypothetical protein